MTERRVVGRRQGQNWSSRRSSPWYSRSRAPAGLRSARRFLGAIIGIIGGHSPTARAEAARSKVEPSDVVGPRGPAIA